MRKKPPDGGLLLDSKDRRLKAECQECGVTFYVGHEETSQQTSKRRATLRRSINAAKKKMRRLEETNEAREARLQDDRANKESKRQAESEGVRTVRLQKQAVRQDLRRQKETTEARALRLQRQALRQQFKRDEITTSETAESRQHRLQCLVFLVESDKDVREKLSVLCELFSKVTKPYVSRTGVAGRPHLGVPGKVTGSVGSADLPTIIAAVGPYKTAHVVGCLHHGELLEGSMDFDLLPDYFEKFDREFAEKLVIEAFEEDTGLKVGSGDAENYEDKEGQDTIEKADETETTKEDEEKLGKKENKEDNEKEN